MVKPAFIFNGPKKYTGLTIIELMITLVVLGVLLAIGLPEMRSFIVSNRLSSDVKGFVGLINYARSEAITRNQSVVICPRSDTAIACQNTAAWGQFEIQAFVDVDGNGDRDSTDVLLKTLPAVDTSALERSFTRTVAGNLAFRSVGFTSVARGFDINAIGNTAYQTKYGRRVCVSLSGRVSVGAFNTACSNF